jgi:hypothetical protein
MRLKPRAVLVSRFELESLVTGVLANLPKLPQVSLGIAIGGYLHKYV